MRGPEEWIPDDLICVRVKPPFFRFLREKEVMNKDTFIDKLTTLFPTASFFVELDKVTMLLEGNKYYGRLSDDPEILSGTYKVILQRKKDGLYQ